MGITSGKVKVKPKGLSDILRENPSLTRKITYEEAIERGLIDDKANIDDVKVKDDGIEEAYAIYSSIVHGEA